MIRLINDLFSTNKVVVITGAGISTLSGIKPFRGKDGLYNREKDEQFPREPEYYLSKECFEEEPEKFYEFYTKFMILEGYEPNIVHNVLTELEKQGLIDGIITQNIDGLHQTSGSEKTIDIHGNGEIFYCSKCNHVYSSKEYIEKGYKCTEKGCDGIVRPDIVLYNEGLDEEKINKAIELIHEADVVLVLGSSLTVSTATGLLDEFIIKNRLYPGLSLNKKIYIVNNQRTPYDRFGKRYSDLYTIFETIQQTLQGKFLQNGDALELQIETNKRTRKK